jgi:ABC-type branched-subunit amino acid transport system substrate-binding protein
MKRNWWRVLGAGLIMGTLLAACSSSSSSPTTTASSSSSTTSGSSTVQLQAVGGNASGGPLEKQAAAIAVKDLQGPRGSGLTRGITPTSITIGCVYTATDFAGYNEAIEGAFDLQNKAGGVAGRTLTLVPCKDDGGSVETNVTDTQQLVSQNQVFAELTASEVILDGSTNYLNSNQVPYYGWGFTPGFCGNRWGFGWSGCLAGNGFKEPIEAIQGNLAEAILSATGMPASKVRFATQEEDSAAGTSSTGQFTALFTALGAKVVYAKTNFPVAGTADVTPYVDAILATKPNVVYISTPFNDVGTLAAGLKAAGYKGIALDFTSYVPGLLQTEPQLASALQGEYVNTQIVPEEQNTSYVQAEQKALMAAGESQPSVTLGASIGYAEAAELIEQLKAVGKNLNTKTFDQVVNGGSFTSFTTTPSGGPGELKWPAAHYIPADCAAIVQVKGTNYEPVGAFKCYNSFKVVG